MLASKRALSILTPTLNCRATIGATIESIEKLEQLCQGKIQHLIGDAGSTDGTMEYLREYSNRYTWAAVHELRGASIPATLNALLEDADGAWVLVLNGDDALCDKNLAQLLATLDPATDPTILCGDVEVLSVDGKKIGSRTCRIDKLGSFMAVNHPAMLVSRQVFGLIGKFHADFPTAYDYVWTWSAHCKGVPFRYVPTILAQARIGGISQTRAHRAAKEIYRFKIASGAFISALLNYGAYVTKAAVRRITPQPLLRSLVRSYRMLKGSVDHY